MSLALAGKVAIVTGSSRGIGEAIARRIAEDGATVVVNYHDNQAAAEEVVQRINAEGKGKAVAIKADASSASAGAYLVEETVRLFGRLDVLVCNAAFLETGKLGDIDKAAFTTHFDVNVKSPLFLVKIAEKYLSQGGRVLFITSSTTRISSIPPEYLLYTSTKGAVEQLTRMLAKELGARNITVNAVAPGAVETDMLRYVARDLAKGDEFYKTLAAGQPQKRVAVPEDIAPIVAFLARDEAGWVNGQVIMVNGGMAV